MSAIRADRGTAWLLATPALVFSGFLLLGGVGLSVALSLGVVPGPRPSAPGLDAYTALMGDVAFRSGLWLSLRTAALATAVACMIGVALALVVRAAAAGAGPLPRFAAAGLRAVLDLVLAVPHVIGAVAVLFLLSPSGVISRWLPGDGFPLLTQDGSGIGILAELVWKESVFVALIALVSLDRRIRDLEDVAAGLGATRWQRLRTVTLPRLLPSVLVAAAVSFAYGIGTVEVPQLLGTAFPKSLAQVSYDLFRSADLDDRPAALAVALVTGAVATVGAGLLLLAARRAGAVLRRGA